jgi:hypothetical protein
MSSTSRKRREVTLPDDFTHIKALPIPAFAAASHQHEDTVRKQIKDGKLEVIELSPGKRFVRLTDDHRAVFAAIRMTSPSAT